jgi:hypothetical protein
MLRWCPWWFTSNPRWGWAPAINCIVAPLTGVGAEQVVALHADALPRCRPVRVRPDNGIRAAQASPWNANLAHLAAGGFGDLAHA